MEKIAAEFSGKLLIVTGNSRGNIRIFLPVLGALFHNYSIREQILIALRNVHYELIHVDTGRSDKVFFL
jgi:hypothetical protein